MAPRITISTTPDGELELWLNDEGRDQLVRELMALSAKSDYIHLGSFEGAEVRTGARAYRPTDTVLHVGKVMLLLAIAGDPACYKSSESFCRYSR